jgi:hypothetical protein
MASARAPIPMVKNGTAVVPADFAMTWVETMNNPVRTIKTMLFIFMISSPFPRHPVTELPIATFPKVNHPLTDIQPQSS